MEQIAIGDVREYFYDQFHQFMKPTRFSGKETNCENYFYRNIKFEKNLKF